jgi:hypothetical protein
MRCAVAAALDGLAAVIYGAGRACDASDTERVRLAGQRIAVQAPSLVMSGAPVAAVNMLTASVNSAFLGSWHA